MNTYACNSLKHNHPCSQVRNEKAEDFLSLLQQWDALCKKYVVHKNNCLDSDLARTSNDDEDDENEPLPEDTFEVEKLVDICYGDPRDTGTVGLWFKVQWKRYDLVMIHGSQLMVLAIPLSVLKKLLRVDIGKYFALAYGFLGRYALSRLVAMNYQSRLGMMVAGCYGLPQFRMRAFLWGALPSVVLPKFPLPTHDVVKRGVVPNAFSQCLVAYDETEDRHLRKALVLADAIFDLPKVGNYQPIEVMEHRIGPKPEFQRYIRLNRKDMKDYSFGDAASEEGQLFDHQPLELNNDDYERVRQIPGANFRDLKGVQVRENNTVEWVPNMPRVLRSSGKPLVPKYAMTFVNGRSAKPFGRLWWDETVPTVVTRAEPRNQIILHPTQDRVLTIRENARLQGFPDYYRLFGPIKQKYIQVGNAVAVPVARALGYSLGQAYRGEFDGDQPLFKLPDSFIRIDQATDKKIVCRYSWRGSSGVRIIV